jgi:hypothetical protein
MLMQGRPTATSLSVMLITVVSGLTIRFAHLGLPTSMVKYGGSALWAAMIYWVCSTLLPSWRLLWSAMISGILGTAIEFLKLYNPPWLDAFRSTLPGILLLGRIFNPWDIVVYWIAIALGVGLDFELRRNSSIRH